jgi:aryl-alcohol dehydrogenase-like predicted oxidoreductase
MQYASLGGSDIRVSRLCLGTWNMGTEDWGPQDDDQSIELIRRAQDAGCNFFDSAHGYGAGKSEQVLGRALADGDRRRRAVIATKLNQCPPDRVEEQLDAALLRLQTDYVDLYIVHWPRPSQPLEPFLQTMCEMRDRGKARQIGVSNFNLEQMQVAARYGVVSLQPPYNLLWRIIEPDVLSFCRENDIAVTPYSSLAQGLLTGRFTRATEPLKAFRRTNLLFREPAFTEAKRAAALVDEVADTHGWTSSQVALAWLLRTPGVTSPLIGISRWQHWEDNAGALEIELSDAEYERLSEAGMAVWRMFPPDETMWGWKPE